MDHKDARREDHERDRGQVLDRIVRQLFIEARMDVGGTACLQAAAPRHQGGRPAETRREFEWLCQGRRTGANPSCDPSNAVSAVKKVHMSFISAFSRSVYPGGAESSLPPAQTSLDKHTV